MSRKITTIDFVKRAKEVHRNEYDYSKVVYTASRNPVIITCKIHGDFTQIANTHTGGKGCKKCGIEKRVLKKTIKEDELRIRLFKKFGESYTYNFTGYINNKSIIKLKCEKHGYFYKSINHLMYKGGCSQCSFENHTGLFKTLTHDEFLEKALIKHNNIFDYSLSNYTSAIIPIKIICRVHGVFEQTPHAHLTGSGCNQCGINRTADARRTTTEEFIKQCNEKHDNRYSYDNVIYKNNGTKVIVTCEKHGNFKQTPGSHLSGNGCPMCGRLMTSEYGQNNPTGWSYTSWINASYKSKQFDSFKVYVIKCWNENEIFYKIGRTFKSIKNRFGDKNTMPYNYEVELEIISDANIVVNLEKELQRNYKHLKYSPVEIFGGKYECFTLDLPIDEIISYLNSL